jgi:hypothetical protein
MARTASFTKRTLITKANSTIVIATAMAAFIVVFTLVAAKSLVSQAAYQNKVIDTKKKALAQIKSDLNARDSLVASYKKFTGTDQNVIGGSSAGAGDKDGNNAQIALDALPSKYNFPALADSIEKLVTSQGMSITSIGGTDQEITQQAHQTSPTPTPIPMPFQVQASGSYQSVQQLLTAFNSSIRPFQIQTLEIDGTQSAMNVSINAQTFYQPEKNLSIKTEVLK